MGKTPDFALEIASQNTARYDTGDKRLLYAELGFGEYWRYDATPDSEFYGEPLVGERLVDGEYVRFEISREPDGLIWAHSPTLGLDLCWDDGILRYRVPETGEFLPDYDEAMEALRESETRLQESEAQRLRAEAELERVARATSPPAIPTKRPVLILNQHTSGCSMQYETVIGLEVHVQLDTRSKMFCACPADYQDAEPNTRTCPVCLGLPGALPVINRRAVEYTMMTGLALHCSIPEFTKFDRKNYPYPDLMKGYQISQYDLPLALDGYLEIDCDPAIGHGQRRIGVERVHLEEDVAKMQHFPDGDGGEGYSLVDVNRSGVPLMEIVSRPDLRSPEEARRVSHHVCTPWSSSSAYPPPTCRTATSAATPTSASGPWAATPSAPAPKSRT